MEGSLLEGSSPFSSLDRVTMSTSLQWALPSQSSHLLPPSPPHDIAYISERGDSGQGPSREDVDLTWDLLAELEGFRIIQSPVWASSDDLSMVKC